MKTFSIDLKEFYGTEGGKLTAILSDSPHDAADLTEKWKRPAVVVVPGGAYSFVSKREGEPIAQAFLARGFQAFILEYLVSGDEISYPEQLTELAAAVDYVKKHADEMHVNAKEVFAVFRRRTSRRRSCHGMAEYRKRHGEKTRLLSCCYGALLSRDFLKSGARVFVR